MEIDAPHYHFNSLFGKTQIPFHILLQTTRIRITPQKLDSEVDLVHVGGPVPVSLLSTPTSN